MSIYKRCSDKTKCIYFIIRDENIFDRYMKIWENVTNIIKKKLLVKKVSKNLLITFFGEV